ncbi:hypothetical protein [Stappia indica]|uniref:hypothetical protein n=1 Tax=Stappia indica TaxID=538381 RepID=UPI00082CD7CA|nr:hypothetical protein [Stappia indica]
MCITAKAATLLGVFLLATGCQGEDPEAAVRKILAESSPDLSQDALVFNGCELKVTMAGANAMGWNIQHILRADLSMFDIGRAGITPNSQNSVTLSFDRKPVDDKLLDQAERISKLLPVALQNNESIGRDRLEQILKSPNGTLVFRLTSVGVGDGPIQPHKDAPQFYDFAQQVAALPAPQLAGISLQFNKDGEKREDLISGAVMVPQLLQFTASSPEQAQGLAEALNAYRKDACAS